jgi:hypothetical protein
MNTITTKEVLRIAEDQTEKIFGKDFVDFNLEEYKFLAGYTAGILKGLRMAGIEIQERNKL